MRREFNFEGNRPLVKGLFEFVDTKYPEIPAAIKAEKVISDKTEEALVNAINEFKKRILISRGELSWHQ